MFATHFERQRLIEHPFYGNVYVFDNDFISNQLRTGQVWEPELIQRMARWYIDGTDVLDIGCNLGLNSLGMARLRNVTGTFHLFEFQPFVATLLEYNTRVLPRRKLYTVALAERHGTVSMDTKPGNIGFTSTLPTTSDSVFVTTTAPLDSFAFPRPVSIAKIDVEGNEDDVLRGAQRFFVEHRPILFIEIWNEPERIRRTTELLQQMRYRYHERLGDMDHVFVPAEFPW